MLNSISITSPPNFFISLHERPQRHFRPKCKDLFISKIQSQSSVLFPPKCKCSAILTSGYKTTTDWNSQIREHCEVGNLRKAMELLHMSSGVGIETSTYCSLLQLCAERKSIQDGEMIHSIICSIGVSISGLLGSKLVFMYVTCGDLRRGRMVFDEIDNSKVFLWNLMINGYAKVGDFGKGVNLYRRMLNMGIEVNSHTLSCVLKCFAALGSEKEGQCVHGYLLKMDFGSCVAVVNSLLAFYIKIRRMDAACKLFDKMDDRDVISWNSMISGYVESGLYKKGIEVFKEMMYSGLSIDLTTVVGVLAACAHSYDLSLGKAVHAFALKAGFDRKLPFGNILLDMYSKSGDLTSATQVFKKMDEKSVVSWTSWIAAHAREGQFSEAIRLFHQMLTEGTRPDTFAITTVLHACACSESLEAGKEVHKFIRENRIEPSVFVSNALMDMYAKCRSMEDANSVFLEMPVKDVVSWNTMVGGYVKNGFPIEALSLFAEMVHESKPDGKTIACVLPACASLAAIDRGKEIHGHVLRNESILDQHVANALIDMYMNCGAIDLAKSLFNMVHKDLISWTVMISGYAMHGLGTEAVNAFNKMKQAGITPNEVSFVSILHACSRSGSEDEGWMFFKAMQNECNVRPNLEHYACMVDLLVHTGKLEMAYKFIQTMPIEPGTTIWESLLNGCRMHCDIKLAEKVADHLFKLEPENSKYYLLMANIYAEAEKWEEVKKLRGKIGHRGSKKNSGYSFIEIKGKFQIFVSGDGSYPRARQIASLLKKLESNMQKESYVLKKQQALINASDRKKKDIALCGHSEKLAMAFAVLTLPPGRTIRVTKNLRVCYECHEMAKFMSKLHKREIVLRDSNRFHQIKDGTCSCRGIW